MPPTPQAIKDYLHLKLTPYLTTGVFAQWLDELFEPTNKFGQVLALNLYIDLKTGAINESAVAKVLNNMVHNGNARTSFYQCVEDENNQPSCLCQHLSGQQQPGDDQYVRIMPFSSMVRFSCPSVTNEYTPEAEREVEENFYAADRAERFPLSLINARWRGRMDNVWVTSKAEFNEILSSDMTPNEKASRFRTRLGFYEYDTGRLIYFLYPASFNYDAFQPTSLDANTTCFFFVSKEMQLADTWGETCSLNPAFAGMKERVHRGFQGLTDDFETEIIGQVEAESADIDHLLNVAWSRVP
ncbi:MAG TPA: hypothetical protein VJT15_06110 [Pyrinomonadaceae bacterium]|nr:hypothetical protein [Pyrinomonadaceae bacterium]